MITLLKSKRFEVVRKSFSRKGQTHTAEAVVHSGSVVVLPMLAEDRCLLLCNNRWAVEEKLWEVPAGTLDVPGESLIDAAARELEEEAGYKARKLEKICCYYPSPGFLTEQMHCFVATELTRTQQRLQETEDIEVVELPLGEAIEMVFDGRIKDGKTIVLLLMYDRLRRKAKCAGRIANIRMDRNRMSRGAVCARGLGVCRRRGRRSNGS
jgi:ADP-ribose pyrophosphatase